MRSIGRVAVHFGRAGSRGMSDSVNTKILEVLESIRPALQADGGDLEFLSFNGENLIVELRLLGECDLCPISMMTLQ